jgi:uncharacterized protein involved in exopolysaccharide biosynthesis
MTVISDRPDPSFVSGARAFARLDAKNPPRAESAGLKEPTAVVSETAGETVTLNKIGTFLELDLGRLFVWLRAGLFFALVLAVIGALAGGAYGILGKPMFTVSSDILINPAKLQVVPNDIYADPAQVDGQILNARSDLRVLTSRNVLARVVDDLNLVADKEFYDPNPGFSLSRLFGAASTGPTDPKLEALGTLATKVRTQGDDKSYVATLLVTAWTSDKAIAISQAIFQAFRDELAKAEADGASRTAAALADRLNQLKTDVQTAEEKVEAYKRAHNLVATDNGSLVTTQTMTQLNTQVVDAQARVVAAQSAYDALVAAGRNATTQDTETSTALTTLRTNAGALQQQLDSESLTLGPKHPTIMKLKAELSAVDAQLDSEIARIVSAAKATLDQAKASLAALTAKSDGLQSGVLADNDAMVTLRQLERDATSKSTVYEGFLARARQIAEQEQIDTSNVRVISPAVPPDQRSWPPRTVLLVIGGAFGGLALGLLFAIVRGIWRDVRRPATGADTASV